MIPILLQWVKEALAVWRAGQNGATAANGRHSPRWRPRVARGGRGARPPPCRVRRAAIRCRSRKALQQKTVQESDRMANLPQAGPLATFGIAAGPRYGEQIPVPAPVVTVGRGAGCQVLIDDDSVSAQHARLEYDLGAWRITD